MFLGILFVFLLSAIKCKKHKISINDLFIIAAFSLLLGLIGAGTLYAFTKYSIYEMIKIILSGKFELLSGLVFYGGLIFGVLGGIIGIKVSKTSFQTIEVCIVPFLPIGHAIGRVGCLLAGCCCGIEYSGLFAIYYPNSVTGYFPVQLLEAFFNILISISLILYTRKPRKKYSTLFMYLLLYAILRFLIEFLRGDSVRGIYFGISTSQWISLLISAISLSFFYISSHKYKKPFVK